MPELSLGSQGDLGDLFVDTLRHMIIADPLTFENLTA